MFPPLFRFKLSGKEMDHLKHLIPISMCSACIPIISNYFSGQTPSAAHPGLPQMPNMGLSYLPNRKREVSRGQIVSIQGVRFVWVISEGEYLHRNTAVDPRNWTM
jgi:hypothetical protein